jgi:FAD/FMN-containing dehydrogenase
VDYDAARRVWNARIDRRPAAIVRCASAGDVAAALEFVREAGLPVAIRGGGHDYAGHSTCDGGIVIDLSPMQRIEIDPPARRVRVGAGTKWGQVYEAAQVHGLAPIGGTVSTVGVAGFTLGGGMGNLSRRFGLGVDNLLSAEVVTVTGDIVRASETENPDLFWALRGGGGNFGVVTEFELRVHDVGRELLVGQVFYPFSESEKVLRAYREFALDAPDEMVCYAFILNVPPVPEFPEEHHGEVAIALVFVHCGEPNEGLELVAPLRQLARPILDVAGTQSFLAAHQMFDAGMPGGLRWYSRSSNLNALTDEAISTLCERTGQLPAPYTMAYLSPMGGAISRVEPEATAFPQRDPVHCFHVLAGWSDPADDEASIRWTQELHEAMARHATPGVYVNLLSEDEVDRVAEAYSDNFARLAAVKSRWDPDNLLSSNNNIPPAGGA